MSPWWWSVSKPQSWNTTKQKPSSMSLYWQRDFPLHLPYRNPKKVWKGDYEYYPVQPRLESCWKWICAIAATISLCSVLFEGFWWVDLIIWLLLRPLSALALFLVTLRPVERLFPVHQQVWCLPLRGEVLLLCPLCLWPLSALALLVTLRPVERLFPVHQQVWCQREEVLLFDMSAPQATLAEIPQIYENLFSLNKNMLQCPRRLSASTPASSNCKSPRN